MCMRLWHLIPLMVVASMGMHCGGGHCDYPNPEYTSEDPESEACLESNAAISAEMADRSSSPETRNAEENRNQVETSPDAESNNREDDSFSERRSSENNDDLAMLMNTAVRNYAQIAEVAYGEAVNYAKVLEASILTFIENPSEASFSAAKQAWLESRLPYVQTEVYRFYDGPIDNSQNGFEHTFESMLNAWPVDGSYLDYTTLNVNSGIIQSGQDITAESLRENHQIGGEENVSLGFHAIEFLLWGQDLDDEGPGSRPFTDYLKSELDVPPWNQERRALYLKLAVELLVLDLEAVHAQWKSGSLFREKFEEEAEESFQKILLSMSILSGFELAGELIYAALDDGITEQSEFSDNTHVDIEYSIRGIHNVWFGCYGCDVENQMPTGGVHGVLRALNTPVADTIAEAITESMTQNLKLAENIPPPFDQHIKSPGSDSYKQLRELGETLGEQAGLLDEALELFGVEAPDLD